MSGRVAVASIDSKYVNQSFAYAREFLLFDVREGKLAYAGSRENPAASGAVFDETKAEDLDRVLSDCRTLVVSHIDAASAGLLGRRGIRTFTSSDPIARAVHQLVAAGKLP